VYHFIDLAPATVSIINCEQQVAFLVVKLLDWLIRYTFDISSYEIQNQNYMYIM
jgi:hypothetical protein